MVVLGVTVGAASILLLGLLILRSGACDVEALRDEVYSWDTDAAFPGNEGLRENMQRVKATFRRD